MVLHWAFSLYDRRETERSISDLYSELYTLKQKVQRLREQALPYEPEDDEGDDIDNLLLLPDLEDLDWDHDV